VTTKISSDQATCDYAKRFMTAFSALRSHIATQSVINYPPGLSPNQLKMLHLVFHRPGISQTAVAERLGVTTASISTSVREMEAQGLIERRPNPDDARVMLLYLAPFGEQIFEQVFDRFINTCADLLGAVAPDDQQQLVERLEAVLVANNITLDNGKISYVDKLHVMKDNAN
jgi:DNA-binding MarR family transcriptional regulator